MLKLCFLFGSFFFVPFSGGINWISCLLIGQLSSFVAVHLHSIPTKDNSNVMSNINVSDSELWSLLVSLELSFVLFFFLFARTINPQYITTFFTTMTAKRFCCSLYVDADTDEARSIVFSVHSSYYESIRTEVQSWVAANWIKWNEDKPEWFSTRFIASVPKYMIPEDEEIE